MGNKLRHEGDEVRIKVIWPEIYTFSINDNFSISMTWSAPRWKTIASRTPWPWRGAPCGPSPTKWCFGCPGRCLMDDGWKNLWKTYGKTRKNMGKHGKNMEKHGKTLENMGKYGKIWKHIGKMWENMGYDRYKWYKPGGECGFSMGFHHGEICLSGHPRGEVSRGGTKIAIWRFPKMEVPLVIIHHKWI